MDFVPAFAAALRVLNHTVPRTILRLVPQVGTALSLANFYFYAQALGLLWVFVVSLTGAIAVNVLTTGGEEAGNAARRPLRTLAVMYSYYCVCRMLALGSNTMWTVMWETYHDFPTLRQMLLGSRPSTNKGESGAQDKAPAQDPSACGSADQAAAGSSEAEVPKLGRTTSPVDRYPEIFAARRRLVLAAPLVVLTCLNCVVLVGQGLCEGHLHDHCKGMPVLNPTARVNRNLRFVLFVAMLQWVQAWTGLFPKWYLALKQARTAGATFALWSLRLGLVPASLLRFCVWLVRPAGTGVSQLMLFGLRHFFIDAVLVAGWSLWLLLASAIVLSRTVMRTTGFSIRRIADDTTWEMLTASFKFTLVVWQAVSFTRGCAKLGFAHAQSDWIFITIIYPWLLALIWTTTFAMVTITRYGSTVPTALLGIAAGAAATAGVAWLLCRLAGRPDQPLLVAVVALHLGRQAFRLARGLLRRAAQPSISRRGTALFSVSERATLIESSSSERRLAGAAVQVFLLICGTFLSVLAVTVLLGGLQQRAGLVLEDIVYWNALPEGVEIVNAQVSRMRLQRSAANASADVAALPPGAQPRYAICGHRWYGLTLLDYSLLAGASYISATARNDLPGLLRQLMPNKRVAIRGTPSNSRKWLDLEVTTCNREGSECSSVTIISISGTDPTRISDYAENIRMWTEPVALQFLSALFPSVRTWPRGTTGEVIALNHNTLQSLALQDDRWHYQEILDHVRKKPPTEQVVLTGHSLGGGMALVVGALTGRLAVALQPPGVYHSLAKHQVQHQAAEGGEGAVHQRSVTLKFEGDWIQHFDEHGGLVQTMICDRSHQGVQMACHMLEGATCHLLRHCGDEEQRFASCVHEYEVHSAALTAVRSLWAAAQRRWKTVAWAPPANFLPALRSALCVSLVAGLRTAPRLMRWWLGAGSQ